MWYYLFYVISEIIQHSESFFFIYNFLLVSFKISYMILSISYYNFIHFQDYSY